MSATDLEIVAELIALIYRYRWQVELFFKWIKCILRCRHLLAESPSGVPFRPIAPSSPHCCWRSSPASVRAKRVMELVEFFFLGYIDTDELARLLKLHKNHA